VIHNKIVFSGPVGAGKTTAIGAVSDLPPVTTDTLATDEAAALKPTTTVAMDYGVLLLDGGEKVHLYGTPGQDRFDFMRAILAEGAIGIILLVTSRRPDPVADLRHFVADFGRLIQRTHLAVGVTGMDVTRRPPLPAYRRALADAGVSAPVFETDARRREDVALLIQALLVSIDPALAADAARDGGARPAAVETRDYW